MVRDSESKLLARCRQGDPDAWDEVFDLHYAPTARFVFQLGHQLNHEDTEEICQETFLSVIRRLPSFRGGSQFQTWVFRIAANKARDYLERQKAAKRGGGQNVLSLQAEDPESGLTLDPAAGTPGPDDSLVTLEQGALLRSALDELGNPCREIIELRYFGDLRYEEISAALSLNPKTVSSRLSKCLDRLEVIARKLFSGEQSALFPSNP